MAKKRAGIFDPWRQERPDIVVPVEPQRVSTDPEDAGTLQPVRFAGRRGGVTVWLSTSDPANQQAQARVNLLAALTHLLTNKALTPTFVTWGIASRSFADGKLETSMSDGVRTVVVRGDYVQAVDAITFALRDATRLDARTGDYLLSLGIRPYVV